MEFGKYIIVAMANIELAIMFDSMISHDDLLRSFHKDSIVSAGMFTVGAESSENDDKDISVDVFGESVTLKKKVRKGQDEILIKRVLRKALL
ncbi:hypothetical protein LCGC14_1383800 [marine sediment metagenome]|uniref:Uncharacterized protein n=1 Tax=marine sediment metagenome TaxID=412755 RepID=A0A0F9MH92_9ZZZZ